MTLPCSCGGPAVANTTDASGTPDTDLITYCILRKSNEHVEKKIKAEKIKESVTANNICVYLADAIYPVHSAF